MSKITKMTMHAGHNAPGKIAVGASDYLDESTEARIICKSAIKELKKAKIRVVNCTVKNGTSQNDVLKKIREKIEKVSGVILNVSIHFNAFKHEKKDGKTKGVEACIKPVAGDNEKYEKTKATMKYKVARAMCDNISLIGFENRGVRFRDDLYILNQTSKPTILLEVCFVDDQDDAIRYKRNKDNVAKSIAKAVIDYNKKVNK